MGIFSGCLLACDIDGTLMDNGYINQKNVEAIEYFMNEGGFFAIATGRNALAISDVTNTLLRISPSVVSNGCMIYDYENKKILHQEFLPKSDYYIVKEVLESSLNVGIEVHTGQRVFTLNETAKTALHQKYQSLETTVISYEEAVAYDWNKVLFTCDDEIDFEKLKNLSKKYDKTSRFVVTGLNLDGEHQKFLEHIPINISKASAIKRLCQMFNIKDGCSFAIGDYFNDKEMLENADISASVAGAPTEIKQIVDFVACECRDGAVSDFIDYLKNERKEKMDISLKKSLQINALKARMGIIKSIHSAKAGHPGGSLSCVDILTYLYFAKMNIDPKNPKKADRDRLVLSKGHAAPALYSVLANRGYFDTDLLLTLRKQDSILQGHPDMKNIPGVDMSTGSLGQGISCAVGMALSSKHFGDNYKVYTVLGDGELEEGQVWEAAMFAANKNLSNLTVFVDYNGLQIDGTIEEVNSAAPIDKKFEAFNWHTIIIDGHDFEQIEAALNEAEKVDKPVAIIAKTVKGKGVSFMENAVNWHGSAPNDELAAKALAELDEALAQLA